MPNKQHYRAIKYVWKAQWIGEEAYKKELIAAQQACVADIVTDYTVDCESPLSDADIRLTILHIKKYAQCSVVHTSDRCYVKVLLEIDLQPK